jgi:uncharacterized Zn-binding protein involved in type VI secretion
MLAAARLGDKVTHTSQLGGLIGGMIVGALVGAALVAGTIATVLTGGLALGPILLIAGAVCTGAAVGGGIGRLLGGESRSVKGSINKGAATVFINSRGKPAARACIDTATCSNHPPTKLIATGSTTVVIEGYPAARVKDVGQCSFEISEGSENVFIGGETGQCAGIEISPEVPEWLETFHHAIGIVGALCLLGPAYGLRVAVASIIGSELGGRLGGQLGLKYGGKWGGVFGSLLGGFLGGGIPLNPRVASLINRLEVDSSVLGTAGGNIRLRPKMEVGEVDTYGNLKTKTGEGLLDRDHMPSKAALKERAEQLKGEPLTPAEARRIENQGQTVAVPKDIHQAGPTYGGKNTSELSTSDAGDLAGATRRDADAMVDNARRLDPNNLSTYERAGQQMKDGASDNAAIDDWLRSQLDP